MNNWIDNSIWLDENSIYLGYAAECEGDIMTRRDKINKVIKMLEGKDIEDENIVYYCLEKCDLLDLTEAEKYYIENNL